MVPLVLVIDDETVLAQSIAAYLDRHGYATAVAGSAEEGLRLADEASPDVAVVDVRLPGADGLRVLTRLRNSSPLTEVIMMTAHASVPSALEAMKLGAFDYLLKPVDLEEIRILAGKAVAQLTLRRELSYLKARQGTGPRDAQMLGASAAVRALRAQIDRIAMLDGGDGSPPTVLVLGETGVGKELVARAIHGRSPRASGPFIELNCAAIPSNLLEAELFGYEKGAYTDAKSAKPGLFEAADGGTIFLDEIGHVDAAVQVKLLKAIEDKTIRRVGGLRAKPFQARIVTATNRDLAAAVAEGAFRADLYYRIHALTVEVPPLRDRDDDVVLLAEHFLARFAQQYGMMPKALTSAARAALRAYQWPGNVRELAHVIERAVLLHGGDEITPEELGLHRLRGEGRVAVTPSGEIQVDFSKGPIVLEDVERTLILGALQAAEWNRGRAAELLSISKETLRYRIEKYNLKPPE